MFRVLLFVLFLYSKFLFCQKEDVIFCPNTLEEYFETKLTDEYRCLEILNNKSTINWFNRKSDIADSILNNISNQDYYFNKRLEYEKRQTFIISDLKIVEGNQYFYLKRSSGEKLAKLYYRKGFKGKEVFLYDPINFRNSVKNIGTNSKHEYVINLISPSWDGSKVAISLSEKGKEISEVIVLNVKKKKILPEIIINTNPSSIGGIKWLPDNNGFFYVYYPIIDAKSNLFAKNTKSILYRLGNSPSILNDVFSREKNPNLNISEAKYPAILTFSPKDKYYIGILVDSEDFRNTFIIKKNDLLNGLNNWKPLYNKDDRVTYLKVVKNDTYFLCEKNAPNFKLCKTNLDNPNFKDPQVIVKEKENEVLNQYTITKDGLYYTTIINGIQAKLYFQKFNGEEKQLLLPYNSGSINLFSRGIDYSDVWVTCSGWTSEERRFRYNLAKDIFILEDMTPTIEYPEFKDIISEETSVKSHDGVEVPLTLIYNKNIKRDGTAPTLIYSYGAFSEKILPFFAKAYLLWASQGGVFAIAHVRGGGEKGENWHKEGMKAKKPNSWKDFIACTEYLIDNRFASSKTIGAWGQSAGGITVGRAITERPELYKTVILESANLNTIRLRLNGIGGTSIEEFGDPEKQEDFISVLEMDSYHHLRKGVNYPSALITYGLNDTRIAPWNSIKFATKMQAYSSSKNPILLKLNKDSGHGIEDPIYKIHKRNSQLFAFAFWQLGHPGYQSKKDN